MRFLILFVALVPSLLEGAEKEYFETGRFTHDQLVEWAQTHGSPLYVYDGDLMVAKFHKFKAAYEAVYPKIKVFYALKANTNMSVVGLLSKAGANAECISMGEMKLAMMVGRKGEDIIFTASSKSPTELAFAVENGVVVNLDSLGDLENLSAVTAQLKKKARISFRINPDVDPKTHRHISTGHKFSKFGILFENDEILEAYRRAAKDPHLEIWGIHSHIGSQITDTEPFERNVKLVTEAVRRLKKDLGIELKFINLGGGLGIPYKDGEKALEPEFVAGKVSALIKSELAELGYTPELWLEPGRYFVGDAGFLISRVNSVKHTPYKHFINVDTGFNHLVRPILYEAYHRVRVLNGNGKRETFDIAGNICETGDILAHDRRLPTPKPGDYLVFMDAGAYGFSMASEYNSFLLPAELLVRGDKAVVIRSRETWDDLLRNQVLLPDLK